jgi:putative oxidoreductase
MSAIAAFIGRILLAVIFIVSGASKLLDPAGTEAMITGVGLPAGLAIPTGVFELVAGLAIALGFMTRLFALLLAGFCLVTIVFFHNKFEDPMQAAMAMKNLAIAGGFLSLFAATQMRWSYDSMRLRRKGEIATREAEQKAHEAELRAVKAEARADTLATVPLAGGAGRPARDLDGDGIPDRIDPSVRPAVVDSRGVAVAEPIRPATARAATDRNRGGVDGRDLV